MKEYSTSQIAEIVGVHPNTVRFYEEMKLLPPIPRRENGYRRYNDFHLAQLKLIRTAFNSEILSGDLRNMTIDIIRLAAGSDFIGAIKKTCEYKAQIAVQKANAEEAIEIIEEMLREEKDLSDDRKDKQDKVNNEENHGAEADRGNETEACTLTRKKTAAYLGITVDVLRDWERNGLITVPRAANGYRIYGRKELKRLKIIRTLRDAHYSMMSILRMLVQVDRDSSENLRTVIDTPSSAESTEGLVYAADRFITSLSIADSDGDKILGHIADMEKIEGTGYEGIIDA